MKHCRSCLKEKEVTEFANNRATRDGLQTQCKECRHNYYKTKVYSRPEERERLKAVSDKFNKEYREHKNQPCTDCGVSYPYYVMEFDHLRDKVSNVSDLARKGCRTKYLEEKEKCELVCANCHKERTHKRRNLAPITQ